MILSVQFINVLDTSAAATDLLLQECIKKNAGFLSRQWNISPLSCLELFPKQEIVILSPDAHEIIEVSFTC